MAYNEVLADRIREALVNQSKVEEKKMFRGVCFMVNGKMCVCVSEKEMMCRIDPALYEQQLEKEGCRPMVQRGRIMKGFVYVNEDVICLKKDFDYWIQLSLAFNKKAKPSPKRKR